MRNLHHSVRQATIIGSSELIHAKRVRSLLTPSFDQTKFAFATLPTFIIDQFYVGNSLSFENTCSVLTLQAVSVTRAKSIL